MSTPLLKRFVCASCGATGPMPPRSPFVQCGSCGIISDFDLGVFRRHPDWSRHEALHHTLLMGAREELEAAVKANDHARCAATHARITGELIAQCPNAYPQRLATDPAYRAQWVAFQGSHLASLVIEPELVAGGRAVAEAVFRIMKVAWTTDVLMPVFEIAIRHFEAQDRSVARRGCPPPPDFVRGWMRRAGVSMTVQEWLPRIPLAEQLTLVARMGVANEYVAPGSADSVRCGGCGAATSANTTECATCKRTLDLARGAFDCGSCGVRVHLAKGSEQASCPFCSAHMRESRAGLEEREDQRGAFRFIDRELRLACEMTGGATPICFEALDGPVTRRDLPWRRVILRACFANARDQDFFENTDYPDAASHGETDAWLAAQAQVKKIPHRVRRTREHPRCTQTPNAEELEARRAEIDPSRGGRIHVARHGVSGASVEVHLADEIVVLAFDDDDGDHVRRVAAALGWWISGPPVAK